MSYKKIGQISTEYLILVGFITFLVISILGIAFFYVGSASDRIKLNHVQNYATKIISSAESVFYTGEPSRITINVYLPSGVEGIEIVENNLVFDVSTSSGISKMAYRSNVPIDGSLTSNEGVKVIRIVAQSEKVFLSEN